MTLAGWGKVSLLSFRSGEERRALSLADVAVGLGVLALLYGIARIGAESLVQFRPPDVIPSVSLDPAICQLRGEANLAEVRRARLFHSVHPPRRGTGVRSVC